MPDVNANDVVAFLVEVIALVLLGLWAWRVLDGPTWARGLITLAVLGIAIALWAVFASPQSVIDVPALEIATKVLVLGGSVLAAYALAGSALWPTVWAVVVVINTALIYVGPFAR